MKMQDNLLLHTRMNKGSATLTAVIAMLFIIALGSSLLYASYIGYSVSITERGNKDTFYSADAEMKHIITGVQNLVSKALVPAYTTTLTSYAAGDTSEPQIAFSEKTIDNLAGLSVSAGSISTSLLTKSGSNLSYSNTALASFLGTPTNNGDGTVTVSFSDGSFAKLNGGNTVESAISATGFGSITLKNISMEYTSGKGYQTEISADLKISIPVFFSMSMSSDSTGYAIIAEGGLDHVSNGASTVTGSVYVGGSGINVTGNGNTLTINNGNVCAKGGINVDTVGRLVYSAPNKELWTDKITLSKTGTGSSIDLTGKIYVADDLVFAGTDSSALLKGEYFGFGSSNTPSASSAILVNGLRSTLDISGLERLSLAGISYIDTSKASLTNGDSAYTSPIIMGESIATKADQLVYLLPTECLTKYFANPCVLDVDAFGNPVPLKSEDWNKSTVIWTINGVSKTLQYYLDLGPSGEKGEILPLYSQGNDIAYIFIVFKDRSAANEYFRDYFTVYPQRVEQYTDLYLETFSPNATNVTSAGNTFYNGPGNKLTLYANDSTILTGDLSARYNSKRSPFDTYVYRDSVTKENLRFETGGKTVALVTSGNYIYTSADSDLKLIVAMGNVTVRSNFSGMIVAGGKVIIEGTNTSIEAAPPTSDILDAVCVTDPLYNYVRGLSSNGSDNAWDMNKLVVYDDWQKN